jgi:hypothetical protein
MPPTGLKIYHITHMDNLRGIVADDVVCSDREILERGGPTQSIGMSNIKQRRVELLEVDCHPGTKVGDYVPFYFCPRSVMLYVIYRGNHPQLTYRDGQEPIVHMEADLHTVIQWAEDNHIRWAFSLSNAGAYYTEFRSTVEELDQLNWRAIAALDFRNPEIKEGKQAEFLMHGRFPLHLIERIGVISNRVEARVSEAIRSACHRPMVEIRREWYY